MACVSCTKAKRRCSKQIPACSRCTRQGIDCRYPAPRVAPPYHLVFTEDGQGISAVAAPIGGQPVNEIDAYIANLWFLNPTSWNAKPAPHLIGRVSFTDQALPHFVGQLQRWVGQWTSDARCPLIHGQLFASDLPLIVQDAFTAAVAYQSRTPAMGRAVLRIVADRATRLVQQQQQQQHDESTQASAPHAAAGVEGSEGAENENLGSVMLDTTTHLQRTAALVIYTIICLFDGDIRCRAEAEERLDLLIAWAYQLRESASLDVACQIDWAVPYLGEGTITTATAATADVEHVWQAWIFAESVRRVYTTALLIVTTYRIMKQGWTECFGSLPVSGADGLWDAPSAYTWLAKLREKKGNMSIVQVADENLLLTGFNPADLDEFARAVLSVTCGLETLERWSANAG
ncbi:hypothetical protein SODALDRAFT_340157 [Sodiomyces alkalinus F11]|uniref:Zn(2)-C6 fungal-type domain-containing protein n=1 Tax=Sodiomyces alkalinus (strain CBS 110278 / VKM F-3762 / F11) TaxID=1314773 RepID=A0A3N2PTG0_SODAK|nr:hypothetical protein SODALDRAFT_340157 [Sodiomyces alkalinus F11]ROT37790.1 hypothetical protein SODALDRAFT_340157 [Sodiomyces alkalinus F11]